MDVKYKDTARYNSHFDVSLVIGGVVGMVVLLDVALAVRGLVGTVWGCPFAR